MYNVLALKIQNGDHKATTKQMMISGMLTNVNFQYSFWITMKNFKQLQTTKRVHISKEIIKDKILSSVEFHAEVFIIKRGHFFFCFVYGSKFSFLI